MNDEMLTAEETAPEVEETTTAAPAATKLPSVTEAVKGVLEAAEEPLTAEQIGIRLGMITETSPKGERSKVARKIRVAARKLVGGRGSRVDGSRNAVYALGNNSAE